MQATPKSGLSSTTAAGSHVQVLCRFRPVNLEEEEASVQGGPIEWLECKPDQNVVCIRNIGTDLDFTFDRVFDPSSEQEEIFSSVGHVVDGVMEGFNGSILAYGQTSSGKTHTMQGYGKSGVMPRALNSIFASIANMAKSGNPELQVTVQLTFVEIYCERIIDLLSPPAARKDAPTTGLRIYENPIEGTAVQDAAQVTVSSIEDVHKVLKEGARNRATSATKMNSGSSRSHAMLQVLVTQVQRDTLTTRRSKLMLVDLAGSERLAKTGVRAGARMEEAKNINRSLTTLGIVIRALAERAAHVPFRDSKLTRLLQQSLGGNSRTSLIICCASELKHAPETVSTLRFGERARLIATKASRNETLGVKELKLMLAKANAEIEQLKAKLVLGGGLNGTPTMGLQTMAGLGLGSTEALGDTTSLQATGAMDLTIGSLPLPPAPLPSAAGDKVELARKLEGLSMMVRNFAPLALAGHGTGEGGEVLESPRPHLEDEIPLPQSPTPRGPADLDVSIDDDREQLMLTMTRTLALTGRTVNFDSLADSGGASDNEPSPSPTSTRGKAGWEEVGLEDSGPTDSAVKLEQDGELLKWTTDEEGAKEEEEEGGPHVLPPLSSPALLQAPPTPTSLSRSSLRIEVSHHSSGTPTSRSTTPLSALRAASSPSSSKPLPGSSPSNAFKMLPTSGSPSGSKSGTPRGLSGPMWAAATLPAPRRDSPQALAATWHATNAGTQATPQAGKELKAKKADQPKAPQEAVAQEQGGQGEGKTAATTGTATGLSATRGEKGAAQTAQQTTSSVDPQPPTAELSLLHPTPAVSVKQRVGMLEGAEERRMEQQATQTPKHATAQNATQTPTHATAQTATQTPTQDMVQHATQTFGQTTAQNGTQTPTQDTVQNATQTIPQAKSQSATQTATPEPPASHTTSMQTTQTALADLGVAVATATQVEGASSPRMGQQAMQRHAEEEAQHEQPATPPNSAPDDEAVQQDRGQTQDLQDDESEAPIDVKLKGARPAHMPPVPSPSTVAKFDRATSMGPLPRRESGGDSPRVSLVDRLEDGRSRLSKEEQVAALEAEVSRLQAQLAENEQRAEEASQHDRAQQEELSALRKEISVTKEALEQRQQQPPKAHADAHLQAWVVSCLLGCAPCIVEARDK